MALLEKKVVLLQRKIDMEMLNDTYRELVSLTKRKEDWQEVWGLEGNDT